MDHGAAARTGQLMPRAPKRRGRRPSPVKRRERASSTQRGYGYRWQQYVRRYLARHPLCRMCEELDRVTAAQCVDHVTPVTSADDPGFWDPSNHQSLCIPCHSVKTNTVDRGRGRGGR
ncbi:MAG: HNH endonuclease [Planctomycetota bacterium]